MSQSVNRHHQLLLLLQSASLPLTGIDALHQCRKLAESLLQGGVVWVSDGRVLEEVLDEENVSGDSLDGLNQQVIES